MAKTTRKTNAKTSGPASGGEVKTKPTPAEAPAKKATAKKAGVKKASAKKASAAKATVAKAGGETSVAKKTAARKATTRKDAAKPTGASARAARVSAAQRHHMIEQAAYLRAESLGFCSDPKDDWLTAEAEVDARLAAAGITVAD